MDQSASLYTTNMTPQQAAWFTAEYESVRKEEVIGALLAFFLGTFGAHHFYLGRNQLGILYAVFFWTGIPAVCGFVECFLMPGRVREFNFAQANMISARLAATPPISQPGSHQGSQTAASPNPTTMSCPVCSHPLDPSAVFCTRCGAPTSAHQAVPA